MNKNEVYVTKIIGTQETKMPLHELPEVAKRVKKVEQDYKIQVTYCIYEPNKGNLLTMKYTA